MYGRYSWLAGAQSSQVLADMVRWISGGDIAGMSASCNKPDSAVAGVGAGDWLVVDAGYGVLRHPGLGAGPGVSVRLSVSAGQRLQLAVVDGWDTGPHTATHQSTAFDASLLLSSAGSVNLLAAAGVLVLASSDWSYWVCACETKRDGPALSGAAAKSGALVLTSSSQHYMARVKSPGAAGEVQNGNLAVQSAYGSLSSAAARDQAERLYLPMAPATAAYSAVPVGELSGVQMVGGYALSGDTVLDDALAEYLVLKASTVGFAVQRV